MTEQLLKESFAFQLDRDLWLRGDVRAQGGNGPRPIIIISHGFKGFKDWGWFPYAAASFASRGYTVVTFNFSSNGVKETDFDELEKFAINTYSRDLMDLEALLLCIHQRRLPMSEKLDVKRIFLLGHSRGGGSSLIFAAEHGDIKGVVTWNSSATANLFDEPFKRK